MISPTGVAQITDVVWFTFDTEVSYVDPRKKGSILRWMSPELVESMKPTAQSDIFSLALVSVEVSLNLYCVTADGFKVFFVDLFRRDTRPTDRGRTIHEEGRLWSVPGKTHRVVKDASHSLVYDCELLGSEPHEEAID